MPSDQEKSPGYDSSSGEDDIFFAPAWTNQPGTKKQFNEELEDEVEEPKNARRSGAKVEVEEETEQETEEDEYATFFLDYIWVWPGGNRYVVEAIRGHEWIVSTSHPPPGTYWT